MKKRLFALFLCLCMVMTLLPVGAFAEGTEAQFGLDAGGASVTSVNPVETPDTHITFKFYDEDDLLDTQVVNRDGQLTAPATPAIEGGRKFLGWYAVDASSGQLEAQEFDFSNAYTNYSGRSEVKVMAKFEAVFYVYFMTVDGQVHSTAIGTRSTASRSLCLRTMSRRARKSPAGRRQTVRYSPPTPLSLPTPMSTLSLRTATGSPSTPPAAAW